MKIFERAYTIIHLRSAARAQHNSLWHLSAEMPILSQPCLTELKDPSMRQKATESLLTAGGEISEKPYIRNASALITVSPAMRWNSPAFSVARRCP